MSGERLLAVCRADDRVALLLEVEADEVDDVALVVDDEDGLQWAVAWRVGIAAEDTLPLRARSRGM
jgi:hypothetical protein